MIESLLSDEYKKRTITLCIVLFLRKELYFNLENLNWVNPEFCVKSLRDLQDGNVNKSAVEIYPKFLKLL